MAVDCVVFERVVFEHIYEYLNSNNLLYRSQYSQGAKLNNCANLGESVKFGMMLVFGVQNIVQGESKRNNHSGSHFEQNSKWPPNCLVHELTFELFTQEHCVIPLLRGFSGC